MITTGWCSKFYVSVIDGSRYGFLAGPYDTHEEALAMVEPAKKMAQKLDDWAWFYAFGTVKAPLGYSKPGVLNDLLEP